MKKLFGCIELLRPIPYQISIQEPIYPGRISSESIASVNIQAVDHMLCRQLGRSRRQLAIIINFCLAVSIRNV